MVKIKETNNHPSYEVYKQIEISAKLNTGDSVIIYVNGIIIKTYSIVNAVGDLGLTILDKSVKLTDEQKIIQSQIDQLEAEKLALVYKYNNN